MDVELEAIHLRASVGKQQQPSNEILEWCSFLSSTAFPHTDVESLAHLFQSIKAALSNLMSGFREIFDKSSGSVFNH